MGLHGGQLGGAAWLSPAAAAGAGGGTEAAAAAALVEIRPREKIPPHAPGREAEVSRNTSLFANIARGVGAGYDAVDCAGCSMSAGGVVPVEEVWPASPRVIVGLRACARAPARVGEEGVVGVAAVYTKAYLRRTGDRHCDGAATETTLGLVLSLRFRGCFCARAHEEKPRRVRRRVNDGSCGVRSRRHR